MEHILWIALIVTLVAVVLVLLTGVIIFVRGGEVNKRWGNRFMNLRTGTQGVAILILGILYLIHQYYK